MKNLHCLPKRIIIKRAGSPTPPHCTPLGWGCADLRSNKTTTNYIAELWSLAGGRPSLRLQGLPLPLALALAQLAWSIKHTERKLQMQPRKCEAIVLAFRLHFVLKPLQRETDDSNQFPLRAQLWFLYPQSELTSQFVMKITHFV